MKITIEHKKPVAADGSVSAEEISHNVTVEHPFDDMNATNVARLAYWAMTGCSYHPDSVARAFYEISIEQGFDPDDE